MKNKALHFAKSLPRHLLGLIACLIILLGWEAISQRGQSAPGAMAAGPTLAQNKSLRSSISSAAPAETLTATDTPTATSTPECGPAWRSITSPSQPEEDSYLTGVSATSSDDVWAVGYYFVGSSPQTLIEHWDGVQWSIIASPDVGGLNGVSALSATEVWAVGSGILHWDGTSWTIVPWPNPGQPSAKFAGVSARAADDVWAAGSYWDGSATVPLVEHWDGTQWNIVPTPSLKAQPLVVVEPFNGVSAVAADDVWAVGYTSGAGATSAMIGHWDGTQWTGVPSPGVGYRDKLFGVTSLGPDDVWAVGYTLPRGWSELTLIEHWDGVQWNVVSSPNEGAGGSFLYSVTGVTTDNVWAAGYYVDQETGGSRALVEHWDGTEWSVVSGPGVSAGSNILNSISAVSAVDIWGVGSLTTDVGSSLTFAARYNDPCSGNTPTPTPTATPTSQVVLVGHVTWQGPPAQPDLRQQLPITLSLCVDGTPMTYEATTDSSGFFTTTTSLPPGSYDWRAKGPKYLATAGMALLSQGTNQVEMGLQRSGDVNSTHDDIVNMSDFNTLKSVFGQANALGDLNNDGVTNGTDFTLLKGNFGEGGATMNCP